MIKWIVFDLGRVVINENWGAINKDFMEKYGISTFMRSQYDRDVQNIYDEVIAGKRDMINVFKKIIEIKNKNLDPKELTAFYQESYGKNKGLNQELINIIRELRKKYKLACLTDTILIHYEDHRKGGLLNEFDKPFGSHELGGRKRDGTVFKALIKKLGCKANEILFIDDGQDNVDAAIAKGIKAIQFKDNQQLLQELKKFISI